MVQFSVDLLFPGLETTLHNSHWCGCKDELFNQLRNYWEQINHGDYNRWQNGIDTFAGSTKIIKKNWVIRNRHLHLAPKSQIKADAQLITALQGFMPWRKGPFSIGDIHLDTEWHSDWKWHRIAPHIQPLTGRRILDVGCGNGYFGYQMLAAGAKAVIGVDRMLLFAMQHQLMHALAGAPANWVLPFRLEDLPETMTDFDSVFSLGVLYHCKDPIQHLRDLKQRLRPGGELILETFILPPESADELPVERYARMRNIYSIPSVGRLIEWIQTAGFKGIELVDICRTRTAEQRSSEWMRYESLAEALDSADATVTIEGHPSPLRALFIGRY